MTVDLSYNRPEDSDKFTELFCTIERNIKSQIDTIEGPVDTERVQEVILDAIFRTNMFNKLPIVNYRFDDKSIIVNYNAVINNMRSILKESIEYDPKGPVGLDLDRVVHNIIEYKNLVGDKIPNNSFALWREIVETELNKFIQSDMKSIIYAGFGSNYVTVEEERPINQPITRPKKQSVKSRAGIFAISVMWILWVLFVCYHLELLDINRFMFR